MSSDALAQPSSAALLIVDDEPALRDLVVRVVESTGHRCFQAENGEEGLRVFREHQDEITAIISDVNMPVMDGFAFVRAARAMAPGIRVVLSTGSLAEPQQKIAATLGIDAFLPKPYSVSQLLTCARALFGEADK
jgi:two-component system, cell cycle sensor histidine kinase and response regulator CckA